MACCSPWSQKVGHNSATELNWYLYTIYTSYDVLLLVNSWGWFGSYIKEGQPRGITCTAECSEECTLSFKCPHWFRKGYGLFFVPNVLFSIITAWNGKVSHWPAAFSACLEVTDGSVHACLSRRHENALPLLNPGNWSLHQRIKQLMTCCALLASTQVWLCFCGFTTCVWRLLWNIKE